MVNVDLVPAAAFNDPKFDGVVIVADVLASLKPHGVVAEELLPILYEYASVNASLAKANEATFVHCAVLPSKRLVFASTGPLLGDFDDVRAYHYAGREAAKRALAVGIRRPLLVVVPSERFANSQLVAFLGFLYTLHVPLNVRQECAKGETATKVDSVGWLHLSAPRPSAGIVGANDAGGFLAVAEALQAALTVATDIGDGDPQRMAPPRVADYVRKLFAGSSSRVKVSVLEDQTRLAADYPLMAAVNRAANDVPEHQARLITLEYCDESKSTAPTGIDFETLMMVGKGVTIDTGGLDVKVHGAMFGMSLDKYGAAVVAGFFMALDRLRPKGIKVLGHMAMVRNSVGANAYSCDEIITSRSGKRIHIVNTDAEGRIAMLDPLTQFRERALDEKNPHLFTVSTLTGHALLSYGHCAAVMDNGVARKAGYAESLQRSGEECGQPVEISRLFKEDLDFHSAETEAADLRQGANKPSVETIRGHMTPAGFLMRGSRLDEHGSESTRPLQYTHIDMANIMLEHPRHTYPNPLLALITQHIMPRVD